MPIRSTSYASSRVSARPCAVSRPFPARTALNSKCRRMPSRSNRRRNVSPASGSSFGNRLFLEWTRSTSLPSRRNVWANSPPRGPPPKSPRPRRYLAQRKAVSFVKVLPPGGPLMGRPSGGGPGRDPPFVKTRLAAVHRHCVRLGKAGVAEVDVYPRPGDHLNGVSSAAHGPDAADSFHDLCEIDLRWSGEPEAEIGSPTGLVDCARAADQRLTWR